MALLKIGFVGAGGTGKTEVCKYLIPVIPENFIASRNREVFKSLGFDGEAFQAANTPAENWKIQRHLINAKIDQDVTFLTGLFDRTPIDHIAYCLHRCADAISDAEWDWLCHKYYGLIQLYDIIFYFPIYDWGNSHEDGFRQTNKAYRKKIDILMQGIMADLEISPVEMPNIPAEQRASFILNYLNETREYKRIGAS